jgi:hypothetical protein
MWMASCVIREGQGCRSAGEHDQGEGSFGAVESVGPPGHRADLVIESFMAAVRSHRQLHALAMIWVKWPGCG